MNTQLVNESLTGQIIGITGGTGSFGNTMLRHALNSGVSEVRVISRDESKQDAMRRSLNDQRVKYFISDVRDIRSLEKPIQGCDFVFHAAALKQVPTGEFFPSEVIKTNTIGSQNLFDTAQKYSVKKVISLSTDKAVYPINAMGMSKALMEKFVYATARESWNRSTVIAVTRYGNVMCSRGSVIPKFYEDIKNEIPISITDPTMTRFLMSLDEAIDLVLYAFSNANSGDLFIRKAPSATIENLALAIGLTLSKKPKMNFIGKRHGEKKHETLMSEEEKATAADEGNFFRVAIDNRDLNYADYFDQGQPNKNIEGTYASNNTRLLEPEEIATILENLPEYKSLREVK